MSKLPKLRPMYQPIAQTARPIPYSSRTRFLKMQMESKDITYEEILDLKKKKAFLEAELRNMTAKLSRSTNPRNQTVQTKTNNLYMESLQKQVHSMNYIIKEKKQDIQKLEKSDLAASIAELEEETRIFFLEIDRLEKEKKDRARDLALVAQKADVLLNQYSDENMQKMLASINSLKRQIEMERKQNAELESKLKQIKDNNKFIEKTQGHPDLQQQIKDLQQQIRAKQQKISENQDVIDEMTMY